MEGKAATWRSSGLHSGLRIGGPRLSPAIALEQPRCSQITAVTASHYPPLPVHPVGPRCHGIIIRTLAPTDRHSGLVVYGKEYFFGYGISSTPAGELLCGQQFRFRGVFAIVRAG
jgi:hypothetical protein